MHTPVRRPLGCRNHFRSGCTGRRAQECGGGGWVVDIMSPSVLGSCSVTGAGRAVTVAKRLVLAGNRRADIRPSLPYTSKDFGYSLDLTPKRQRWRTANFIAATPLCLPSSSDLERRATITPLWFERHSCHIQSLREEATLATTQHYVRVGCNRLLSLFFSLLSASSLPLPLLIPLSSSSS